jgi:feruloyl esterase
MKSKDSLAAISIAVAVACGAAGTAQAQNACAKLAELALDDTQLTAVSVPAGPFTPTGVAVPGGPPAAQPTTVPTFCRVSGTIEPAIRFEVWLPERSAWNGRYQAVGGGGFAGVLSYGAMVPAIQAGYVTSSTDTGHVAPDVEWLGDEGLLRDYGYRAIHEMTVKSKEIIDAYYGEGPEYSYFNGCSTGGRQGLMEAQRYPEDYDGIVSGAPVNYFVATHYTQLWVALAAKEKDDAGVLSADDLALVNRAVVAQCDADDGLKDGVLEDPRACEFDPAVLQCSGSAGSGQCLSIAQVEALNKIYAGPTHPRTGAKMHPGLVPGGEPSWLLVTSNGLVPIPYEYFGRSVLGTPTWDWRKFDFAEHVALAERKTGDILNAIDPDLRRFRNAGGKLIQYHGWNDQVIFPEGSVNYHMSVADELAPGQGIEGVQDFMRLFMVPGMTHCRGGVGTDRFDAQAAIEAWVERGTPPTRIVASRVENGDVTRTRPLCPYPQVARYDGSGDQNDAANFTCSE